MPHGKVVNPEGLFENHMPVGSHLPMRPLTLLIAGIPITGCAQLESLRLSNTASVTNAPVVATVETRPREAVELGRIEAMSCLNRLWDTRPGWDAALDSLKQKAAAQGANALTDIRYQDGTALFCPSSLSVSATMLKIP